MFFLFFIACETNEPQLPADPAPLRRLSVTQLKNTLNDLFSDVTLDLRYISIDTMDGFVSEAQLQFPPEHTLLGYDNNINVNAPTPVGTDALFSVAQAVSQQVINDSPKIQACQQDDACHIEYLLNLAPRAWRHPLSLSDETDIIDLYNEARLIVDPQDALDLSIQYLLLAPDFLFHLEFGVNDTGSERPLSTHELSNRMSYLLWNTMPTPEFTELANSGWLNDPIFRRELARLMLTDTRAHEGVLHFHHQWMDVDAIDQTLIDIETYFPEDEAEEEGALFFVNSIMQYAMMLELDTFAKQEVFERSGRLSGFFLSTTGYMPTQMAPYYGVQLDTNRPEIAYLDGHMTDPIPIYESPLPNNQRMGFLTLMGSLHARSNPKFPSPVLRGLFVKERLLCQPVAQPPSDIPPIEVAENAEPKTNRERYEVHSSNPSCASCHDSIDGIGFTFENYDSLGVYRETDNGYPVDATGELIGTDMDGPIQNAIELSQNLSQSKLVHDCYTTNWFRYAFGREETSADQAYLTYLQSQFWQTDGDIQQGLITMVGAYPFAHIQSAP